LKISIAATNPCHLWPMARELASAGQLDCYYSGYPVWKLRPPEGMTVRTHSLRTNVVYALLKFAPEHLRPSSRKLFLWQDHGFDRWVGEHLEPCDFVHAMPGQALVTFRGAKQMGTRTVLNHATGPTRDWTRIMEPEYRRAGLKLAEHSPYDAAYFLREDEEYSLTDFHCVASTVVRDQLMARGIPAKRIWVVSYGADQLTFNHGSESESSEEFRILFAGQVCLRKGIKTLLDALTIASQGEWRVDFYGARLGEAEGDIAAYRGRSPLHFHGPVPQGELAEAMRRSSVLVLPSLEEGFGLVVPQALNCGLACIVSDRVGGKDLIQYRENGSIVPVQNPEALASELRWWAEHRMCVRQSFGWTEPAERLIALSSAVR
jgi:alpha-maltose-1-phosphate synthase